MDTHNTAYLSNSSECFLSLLVLFTASERLSYSAFPTPHECARYALFLSRDICSGMVEVKEGGYWRSHPNISPGFLFPRCPWLVLSFPGVTWAVNSPKAVSSAEGLSGMAWLFLLRATWADITGGRVIFLPNTSSLTWKMNFCPTYMWYCPVELFSV